MVDNIVPVIPHKWEQFGAALAMTPPKLQGIRDNHPDNDRGAFCDIIQEWQSSPTTTVPFNWDTLGMVLNSIGESELLNDGADTTRELTSEF